MAKDASQYGITQDYGYDSSYQGNTQHFHHGVDYGAPEGTPVLVNGVQIGLVGHTGKVYDQNNQNTIYAAHLHISRWQGEQETNPGHYQGFTIKSPVTVTTVGYDASNGNFIRLTDGDGVQWIYCHLSRQDVKQGQTLKGGSPQGGDMLTLDDRYKIWRMARLVDPNPDEVKGWEKMDDATFTANLWNNGGAQFKQKADAIKINDIRADKLKQIGDAIGLNPDNGLDQIVNKVKELKG